MKAQPKPVKAPKKKYKFKRKKVSKKTLTKKTLTKKTDNKKEERKRLEKELLGLFSKIIHAIYHNKCACCNKAGTDAHHFFGKQAYPSVKYNTDNGILLCAGCHLFKVHRKGQTEMVRDALINRIGLSRFEALKKEANEVKRYKLPDLIDLKARLLAELARSGIFIN